MPMDAQPGSGTGRPIRQSIQPTYDSTQTGPRYWVSSFAFGRTVQFRHPIEDPFINTTIHLGWWDLLKHLLRGRGEVQVNVQVSGDSDIIDDVLELDSEYIGAHRGTRRAEWVNGALGRMVDGD